VIPLSVFGQHERFTQQQGLKTLSIRTLDDSIHGEHEPFSQHRLHSARVGACVAEGVVS